MIRQDSLKCLYRDIGLAEVSLSSLTGRFSIEGYSRRALAYRDILYSENPIQEEICFDVLSCDRNRLKSALQFGLSYKVNEAIEALIVPIDTETSSGPTSGPLAKSIT